MEIQTISMKIAAKKLAIRHSPAEKQSVFVQTTPEQKISYISGRRSQPSKDQEPIKLAKTFSARAPMDSIVIYVDHINLSKTELHLETSDTRAIVSIRSACELSDEPNLPQRTKRFSKLCGVDKGSSRCNNKPEQLIITASSGLEKAPMLATHQNNQYFSVQHCPMQCFIYQQESYAPTTTLTGLCGQAASRIRG